MYKIILDDDKIVQDSIDNVVISPVLVEKLNSVPTLTYSIPYDDKYYDDYQRRISYAKVTYDGVTTFKGRLLDDRKTFDGNKELTFEGELAFLNDIQYPPYEFTGDYPDFFRNIINYYNSMCDADKRFNIGHITMTDINNYIIRSNESFSSCWNCISEKILSYGGYIKLRYVDNERYLDLLAESGSKATQIIEFGKNLLDLENYIDSSEVATVIVPLGFQKTDTTELEDGVDRTYTAGRMDVKTVNNNSIYVESDLVSKYGRVETVVTWDDVTIPQNLLTKAKKKLAELILENQTISTSVIDLYFADGEEPSFKLGDIVPVVSKPHGIDTTLILSERTRNLNDPSQDTITLGNSNDTLTSTVNSTSSLASETAEKLASNFLNEVSKKQTEILANGKEGNVVYNYSSAGKISEICFMDTTDIKTAVNVLKINKNGIGFSNDGYYGTYRNAWTIDGTLSADFIKTGVLESLTIKAAQILGGSININDKFKVNSNGALTAINGSFTGTIKGSVINGSEFSYTNDDGSSLKLKDGTMEMTGPGTGWLGIKLNQGFFLNMESPIQYGKSNSSEEDIWSAIFGSGFNEMLLVYETNRYIQIECVDSSYGISIWPSDESLKTNIEDTKVQGIEEIKKIKHRCFDWIENKGHIGCGYVAQELAEIDDELVLKIKQKDGSQLYQVNETTLIPTITKALQELIERVEVLEKKVNK